MNFEFITFLVNNIYINNYVDLYRDLNSALISLFSYQDMMGDTNCESNLLLLWRMGITTLHEHSPNSVD
jgi:hypothetical protein